MPAIAYVVRNERAGTASFVAEINQAVWAVNADLPVFLVRTVQNLLAGFLAQTSFTLVMLAIAAAMALKRMFVADALARIALGVIVGLVRAPRSIWSNALRSTPTDNRSWCTLLTSSHTTHSTHVAVCAERVDWLGVCSDLRPGDSS